MPDPRVDDLSQAGAAIAALLDDLEGEHWSRPTPCTEWDVRGVVRHLVGMNLVFTALLEGGPLPDRDADPLGDDPVAAYRSSLDGLVTAFSAEGVLDRSYASPMGSATGAERLQIRLYDLLAHGWDLSRATGRPLRVADDLAAHSLAFAEVQLVGQSRAGRFAEPQPVAPDAPAIDRLAAFLGRAVPLAT